jgi:hypothetical protein
MRNKQLQSNINNSDLVNYPNGRIKNNTGPGNGTPVNEEVYGDLHETKDKLLRLYGIAHNNVPDNETNGYQLIEALIALATKNDYVLPLTTSSNVLRVPLKLGKLKNDEGFILKAAIDKTTQTTINGTLDNVTKSVTFLGTFKQNEYVRMINTGSGIVLVRMIDSFNLDVAIDELNYLKAASQAEEDTGSITTKATTPGRNKATFIKRVNGTDSGSYLATAARDGLLSKEDWQKIQDTADPEDLIKITSATNVQVSAWQNGNQSNNFNFNYVDVFPPAGKTMSDLKGFMASNASLAYAGNVDANDNFWCKWQTDGSKVRIIAGASESRAAHSVNYMGIWI